MSSRRTFWSFALAGLLVLGLLTAPGFAQAGGMGNMTPDQQQAMMNQIQQLQAIGQQVMQNMQNAGVDPQAFMQDIQQQIQTGTFDLNATQQKLIAQGFMTQQMADQLRGTMNQMQGTIRNSSLNTIRLQLNASDEEWSVLLPKIQRVLIALQDVALPTVQTNARGGAGGTNIMGGLALAQPTLSDVTKAFMDLQDALKNPNAADDLIGARLRTWRTLHDKAISELAAARADLVNILTLRQEAILLNLGWL